MNKTKVKTKAIKNQVIVITGASSGIGLATAELAAQRGARVVLASRHAQALDEIARQIQSRGGQAIAVKTDVTNYDDVMRLRERALEEFGTIDTWVNNAGTSIFGYLMDSDLEEEKRLFDINFWGLCHGSRIAVPVLAKNGGVLINLGSEVSGRSVPLQGMYSATKHAVKAFTDALRMELEKEEVPVEVCLVRPASINTPFAEHAKNNLPSGSPSLPNPVYHPRIAAEAILKCAEEPQRDVYVGGVSRLFTIMDTLMPRLTDKFMEKKLFEQQSRGERQTHLPENESLFHPPISDGNKFGSHKGKVATSSVYTNLTT